MTAKGQMNQKERMLKAKELIQKKKFQEARKLLVGIEHPTAKQWIGKIDDILLGDPFTADASKKKQKTDKEKQKEQAQGCLVLFIIVAIAVAIFSSNSEPDTTTGTPQDIISRVVDHRITTDVRDVIYADGFINASWDMNIRGDVDWESVKMAQIACDIRKIERFASHDLRMNTIVDVVDRFGNQSEIYGFKVELKWPTLQRLNCDDPLLITLRNVADVYDVDPVLR